MKESDQVDLVRPYGNKLVNLFAKAEERADIVKRAKELPALQITYRAAMDLVLMAAGAFSPLDRFMHENDYRSVLDSMRIASGVLIPVPIVLRTDAIEGLKPGLEITLRGPTNAVLGIMKLEDIYRWNREEEAFALFGTADSRSPGVSEIYSWGSYCLSGPVSVLASATHLDFPEFRLKPEEVRGRLKGMGRNNVVAYQPRSIMYRDQHALTVAAMKRFEASLLIQPHASAFGENGDHGGAEDYLRIRCYRALAEHRYRPERVLLNLLPPAGRSVSARSVLWHGIVNRNYGANYLLMDGASCRASSRAPVKAEDLWHRVRDLFEDHAAETGITLIDHRNLYSSPDSDMDEPGIQLVRHWTFQGRETALFSDNVAQDNDFPGRLTYPEIAEILDQAGPHRSRQGFCLWMTGLPSSGKSTIADILAPLLMNAGKKVTLLDGDVVRTHLTKGLGFSKEDRITNILRVAFVASEVVRHEGIVICALISPYRTSRDQARALVGDDRFIEIFVHTAVATCEKRDVKGMYAMAKSGKIKGFTGVDDPYEPPTKPDILIDTASQTPGESARSILQFLVDHGYLAGERKPIDADSTPAMRGAIAERGDHGRKCTTTIA